jgi:hypothetical protein
MLVVAQLIKKVSSESAPRELNSFTGVLKNEVYKTCAFPVFKRRNKGDSPSLVKHID